jgi:drug/metabolite transporter (DMT)-like permease
MTADAQTSTDAGYSKGLSLTALGAFLFSFDVPLIRLAAADKWALIFTRGVLLCIAITVAWTLFQRRNEIRKTFIAGTAGVIVVFSSTLANLMFLAAVNQTTAANLVFIIALNPVFCTLFAWLLLKDKIPWQTLLAIALALFGVAIIVWDGLLGDTYVGDLLALGVAICMAVTLTVARMSRKNVVTSLALGALASAIVAMPFVQPATLPQINWTWLALNALVVVPIALALLTIGPRYLPAPEVAMFFLAEVVLTPLWIWMIFGELPTLRAFIGGLVVFCTLLGHSLWRLMTNGRAPIERNNHKI